MLQDLKTGRRLELDSLNGAVVRLGRELGVSTPLNFAIYASLKAYADGPPELPG
jgi:2-dehydropantoate 2-reductase